VFLGLAIGWTVLGALCARYDLAISRWVVDRGAAWAALGERYGSLPGVYALAVAALLSYLKPLRTSSRRTLTHVALALVCSVCMAMAIAVSAYRLFGYRFSIIQGLITFAAVVCFAITARSRLENGLRSSPRIEQTCSYTVLLGASSWLVVHAIKMLWGRVRYRDLDVLQDGFTTWYLPQGPTGHASFPSGHTAMGWVLLPCLMLWPRGSTERRVAAVLSVGWGCFVAASRVVIGAHYVSDVLFSTAFAVTFMVYALEQERPTSGRLDAGGLETPG
jgi:membrane-associated phospholipid phosphatase